MVKEKDEDTKISTEASNERFSTLLSFWTFGFFVTYSFSIMLSAAEDLLAGTHIQTSIVLIANRGPSSLTSMIAPYFMSTIPYGIRIGLVVVLSTGGYLVAAFGKQVGWKLAGVALASFGNGIASISAIALASSFHIKAVSSYSTGTGFGFIGAPTYYTAMTTWICVSPQTTLLFMAPLALVYLISYFVVKKNRNFSKGDQKDGYQRLQPIDDKGPEVPAQLKESEKEGQNDTLTTRQKFSIIKSMIPRLFVPVFIGFMSQYILLQAVVTTISYKNAPFPPRDHYQYYIFIYMLGEFLGRCHRSILGFLSPECLYQQTSVKLWIASLVQVIHVVVLGFESWYRFLPGVVPTMVLTFIAGLAIGVLFNNMLEYLRVALDGKEREFMLGYVSFPMFAGSLAAAFLGVYVEHALHDHCVSVIPESVYCLTRTPGIHNVSSICS